MAITKLLKERNNAYKLEDMFPGAIIYDMQHVFVEGKSDYEAHKIPSFTSYLSFQTSNWILSYSNYKYFNPQNQVLLHGLAYKTLVDIYKRYLELPFAKYNILEKPNSNKIPMLSNEEYKNLPKRYRGAFRKYGSDSYILSESYKSMQIRTKKEDREKLVNLLSQAEFLLSLVYKEKQLTPDEDIGGCMQIYYKEPVEPAFNNGSLKNYFVTDEQIAVIKKLHEIFMNIAKISLPYAIYIPETKNGNNGGRNIKGSRRIYEEYEKETIRKNAYLDSRQELQPYLERYNSERKVVLSRLQSRINSK